MRFIDKFIFMKGAQGSSQYVSNLIADFEKKGASIVRGNGGWMKIDIVKNNELVKLGDVEFEPKEISQEEIESHLFNFFFKKYQEANFLVQEIEE